MYCTQEENVNTPNDLLFRWTRSLIGIYIYVIGLIIYRYDTHRS